MTVVCSLFDKSGVKIAEIEPTWESIAWRLNNVGLARFSIPYADDKCTVDNLQSGNRILAEFDDGLPNFGGILDFPRGRTPTGVGITAYTGEALFDWRRTAKARYFKAQAPGNIFKTLIDEENAESPMGVMPNLIYTGGTGRTLEYHYHDLLRRFKDLAKLTGNDFAVLPVLTDGVLTFEANWYERRGVDRSDTVWLIEDQNLREPVLDEQGQIASRVILVGAGLTWDIHRLDSIAVNATSAGLYGYREYAEVQSGVKHQVTLDANAEELLAELAYPRERLTLVALDAEPAGFADYDVGDIVTVQAFLKSPTEWVYESEVRILAREWRPDETCRLEVETWRAS